MPLEPTPPKLFSPYNTDYLFRAFSILGRCQVFLTGFLYFVISFGGIIGIGLLTGQFHGREGIPPMYAEPVHFINMGFLAPLGAALLTHIYRTIPSAMSAIREERILLPGNEEAYSRLIERISAAYNHILPHVAALTVSLGFNVWIYILKSDTWLGVNGGITAIYARLFIVFDYYMITLVIYKSGVTVYALNKILGLPYRIRPLHPDHAGGLKPLGQLTAGVNYFIALVLSFFTLCFIFDVFAKGSVLIVTIYLLSYAAGIATFFLPLRKAHKQMSERKREVLSRLGRSYDHYYAKLMDIGEDEPVGSDAASELASIDALYQIAEKMPVWPFDTKTTIRFMSTVFVPLLGYIVNEILIWSHGSFENSILPGP